MPRSVIIGIGPSSTQFTEKLVDEIIRGPKGHGLVGIGVYDEGVTGPEVRGRIGRRTKRRLHAQDLSVTQVGRKVADPEHDALVDLKRKVVNLNPTAVMLIVDAQFATRYEDLWRELRVNAGAAKVTAICFADGDADNRASLDALTRFTAPHRVIEGTPILEGIFFVTKNSPLVKAVGGQEPTTLLARSMAGIWAAPLHRNYNPPLEEQVVGVRQPDMPFIGLAVTSQGLTMERKGFFDRLLYPLLRWTTWRISVDHAAAVIEAATRSLLNYVPLSGDEPEMPSSGEDRVVMTTTGPRSESEIHSTPIYVNVMVPFRPRDPKFDRIRGKVQTNLGHHGILRLEAPESGPTPFNTRRVHGVAPAQLSGPGEEKQPPYDDPGYHVKDVPMVWGRGVNLTVAANRFVKAEKGAFYCQICVLYSIGEAQLFSGSTAAAAGYATSG